MPSTQAPVLLKQGKLFRGCNWFVHIFLHRIWYTNTRHYLFLSKLCTKYNIYNKDKDNIHNKEIFTAVTLVKGLTLLYWEKKLISYCWRADEDAQVVSWTQASHIRLRGITFISFFPGYFFSNGCLTQFYTEPFYIILDIQPLTVLQRALHFPPQRLCFWHCIESVKYCQPSVSHRTADAELRVSQTRRSHQKPNPVFCGHSHEQSRWNLSSQELPHLGTQHSNQH